MVTSCCKQDCLSICSFNVILTRLPPDATHNCKKLISIFLYKQNLSVEEKETLTRLMRAKTFNNKKKE